MMNALDELLVLILLTDFLILASSRLRACIRAVAIQGVLLGLLPLMNDLISLSAETLLISAATILIKGVAFPILLLRTMRELSIRREIEPFVGYSFSILFGVLCLLLSLWLANRLPLPMRVASRFLLPVAFTTIFVGFFIVMTRKKALTQVLGYLVAENGIYTFGSSLLAQGSLWIELGVLLDVLVAVFIMGIAINHINSEFASTDTSRISVLRD